jgi:AcrR family transcriptional regulator
VTEVPRGPTSRRAPLTRDRVLRAAVALADRDGLASLSMRRLAQELGVEAMSLYHHVANKDALLAGVVDVVVGEINDEVARVDAPAPEDDWRGALRARILTARTVLLRHRWLPRVLEDASSFSLPVARYFDGVLGTLRAGGFSYDLAHHAMHALGSRALGFTQELFEPDDADVGEEQALALLAAAADQLPHLVGMMAEITHDDEGDGLGWCDDQTEFEFGLDLLLDGLERRRAGA